MDNIAETIIQYVSGMADNSSHRISLIQSETDRKRQIEDSYL